LVSWMSEEILVRHDRSVRNGGFVGIIANPASGKDIRRLVARATTVNNHEKVSIVQRVLLSLDANEAERIEIMPDHFGIGQRALDGLHDHPSLVAKTSLIDMPLEGTAADSVRAARYLRETGAGCLVVLGGDGTCRAVAKGCGDTPLLPISTGTNNVVPTFVEGTVAGAAAAYVAAMPDPERREICYRHKRLLVHVDGELADQALVEVALISGGFIGARAVWRADRVRQVFVARAQPINIGLSSIVGVVKPIDPRKPLGATATVSADGQQVMVPLAPGAFVPVRVKEVVDLRPGVRHPVVNTRPAVLGLDGEREVALYEGHEAQVALDLDGPWIVDIAQTLALAVHRRRFVRDVGTNQ